jgi:glucokinase
MFLRYLLLLLLVQCNLFGIESYAITMHEKISSAGQFVLCTNSGNYGVDCGVFSVVNNKPVLFLSTHVKNENINSFTDMITDFLAYIKSNYGIVIKHACFSGPGVPSAQQDYLTHIRLPYVIDTKEIIVATDITTAIIVNDFIAMSYGIDFMDSKRVNVLYDVPAELHGRRVIIGAGNGLGSASMIWNENEGAYDSLPAEAGTGDFPAHNQFEFGLAMGMKQKRNMSTVHWANFISLSGIEYTYQLLHDNKFHNTTDIINRDGMTILAHAIDDELCGAAADLFFKFYARFVYNFVWSTLPFGGIYLVGETVTMYPTMLSNIFLPAYFDCVISKQPVLKRIPIYVINDDVQLSLYGTARYFLREKKDDFKADSFLGYVQKKIGSLWSIFRNYA